MAFRDQLDNGAPFFNVTFGEANPTVDFANIQNDPAMPSLLRSALGPPRGVSVITG